MNNHAGYVCRRTVYWDMFQLLPDLHHGVNCLCRHAQWFEVLGLASSGATLADRLTINSGRPAVWEGAGGSRWI